MRFRQITRLFSFLSLRSDVEAGWLECSSNCSMLFGSFEWLLFCIILPYHGLSFTLPSLPSSITVYSTLEQLCVSLQLSKDKILSFESTESLYFGSSFLLSLFPSLHLCSWYFVHCALLLMLCVHIYMYME